MDACPATLHVMCGKIASGKSTLAVTLARAPGTLRLSEDALLSRLYPGEIRSIDDYRRCIGRLRAAIGPHVRALLDTGLSVVLDFQANTPEARAWMRGLVAGSDVHAVLHLLDVDDATCKARLRARNATGEHEYVVSDAEFEAFTRFFTPPGEDEGFEVVRHRPAE